MASPAQPENTPLVPVAVATVVPAVASYVTAPPGAVFFGVRFSRNALVAGSAAFCVVGALVLGFAVPPPSADPEPWARISSVVGWLYFLCWAVSFLPQLYLNWTRRCVVGQSFDYVYLNVLGFTFYSIYTCAFYFVGRVRQDYRDRFGNGNNVAANDVAFALYAAVCCIFNVWQIRRYDRGTQTVSRVTIGAIAAACAVFALWLVVLLCGVRTDVGFNTLDILYGLSMVKLAVSVVGYLPQIYLNYARKSTVGWNIWNVLLDFSGGALSVAQELIDCSTTGRWNGIAGNPVKFALGSFSMLYDVVFMTQHYFLYAKNNAALMAKDAEARVAAAHDHGGTAVTVGHV